jgi:hypothetical protein
MEASVPSYSYRLGASPCVGGSAQQPLTLESGCSSLW